MDDPIHIYIGEELPRRDLAPRSVVRYTSVLKAYLAWLQSRRPTVELAREYLLAELRQHQGYRPKSVQLHYAVIRQLHSWQGERLELKLRRPRSLPPYWGAGDVEPMIAQARRGLPGQPPATRDRDYCMVLTLARSGMRRGELLGLRVRDLDFNTRVIQVRQAKGGHDRAVPMHEDLLVPLRQQVAGKAGRNLVFPGINERNFYKHVVRLGRAIGLDGFSPHDFRHHVATMMLERGASIMEVKEVLGHRDISTTAAYLSISPQHLRRAVDLLGSGSVKSREDREPPYSLSSQDPQSTHSFRASGPNVPGPTDDV